LRAASALARAAGERALAVGAEVLNGEEEEPGSDVLASPAAAREEAAPRVRRASQPGEEAIILWHSGCCRLFPDGPPA